MARPNDTEPPAEPIEYLKRRFIRQNRELARINATQAVQIRALELEISRLLAENVTLREKAIHDEVEIRRLKERLEPESLKISGDGGAEEQRTAFTRERREPEHVAILSPIVEDEEKSPVKLRSPITITRIRRPMKARPGRRKSASLSPIEGHTNVIESLSDDLDLTILSPDSPTDTSLSILPQGPRETPIAERSPVHRSPQRSLQVYRSDSPPFRPWSPSKHPPNVTSQRQKSPKRAPSPPRPSVLQPLSPNKAPRPVSKSRLPKAQPDVPLSPPEKRSFSPHREIPARTDTPVRGDSELVSESHPRRRRDSRVVSYAEPSLRKKMRRQSATLLDAAAAGSMVS